MFRVNNEDTRMASIASKCRLGLLYTLIFSDFLEVYSKPSQTSEIKLFAKIGNGFQSLNRTFHLQYLTGF